MTDYYYLHPGSNVTISACTHTTPYAFDIIRGRPNFELWQAGKRGRVFASFEVTQNAYCRGLSMNTSYALFNITIQEEDDGYFAADANDATVNLTLQRYEYTINSSSVLSSCSAGGSNFESCTIPKSTEMNVTYLLRIGPGPSRSNVEARADCAVNVGLVAAIVVSVVVVLIITCICCVVCIVVCGCCIAKGA